MEHIEDCSSEIEYAKYSVVADHPDAKVTQREDGDTILFSDIFPVLEDSRRRHKKTVRKLSVNCQ